MTHAPRFTYRDRWGKTRVLPRVWWGLGGLGLGLLLGLGLGLLV